MSSNYHFMRYFIALLLSLLFLKTKIGQSAHNRGNDDNYLRFLQRYSLHIYISNDFHCSTSHHTQYPDLAMVDECPGYGTRASTAPGAQSPTGSRAVIMARTNWSLLVGTVRPKIFAELENISSL